METGVQTASLAGGFTVLAPILVSANPNTGHQGQQNLSVVLTGQYTNWVQGTTTASFGSGITVASLTVNSATSATAVLNITSTATTGARTITLTTGTEVDTLTNGFTVTAGTPVLLSASPNSGQQGQQNLSVVLSGQFTNWVQGTTTASFGSSITVVSLTVSSATSATAVLNISAGATTGARTVTLTTGTEVDTLTNGFTVTAATPVLLSASPNSGQQGQQNLSVALTGQYTNWVQGTTTASFGAGITVVSLTVSSATSATAVLNINGSATAGARTVTLTTGTEVDTLTNGFTVTAATPMLLSVNPNTGQQGQQNLSVTLTGQYTNWVQGTTTASFGTGITVASLTVTSSTSATALVNITSSATAGARTVTLTTGTEVDTLTNGFTVTSGTPVLVSASPNSGQQGQQNLSVALTGQFTNWAQGTTTASFGSSITVVSLTVSSATSATAVLNISASAATGAQTVTLTTGTEVDTLANGFSISAGSPALLSVSPNSGQQGQQNLSVALTGQFTHFLQGSSQVSAGAGITVVSVTVASSTSATAVVNISPAAATGARTVTVTTGTEVDTLANGFTVTASATITLSVSPNSGQQGQQNLSVAITGQGSHFAQGSTQASFGAGITVATLTVNSPTSATAILNISATAATGAQTVTVWTGSEVGTLTNGFTVTAGTPVLLSATPNSGMQGQQNLPVVLSGQFTNWVQGTTVASFGAGITVSSLAVSSATSATALLNIGSTATTGARTITLTTGSEVDTLTNGFTVTSSTATILSVNPSSGQENQQNLSVSIIGQNTHFVQGTSQASFGTGVTVTSLTVNSSTNAAAILNIDYSAAVGARTVTITTGTETGTLTNGFTITAPTPSLQSLSPTSGQAGQQNVSVTITGQNTHFSQGATTASFGAGITVASIIVNSFTSAVAVLNISSSAATGARTVSVTTGSETESLTNGFTVTSPSIGITVAPNPVAFGNVPITQSSTQTVTISSSGTNPLTVTSISIAGSFFTLKNLPALPLVLSPSATATFSVTYTPLATISSTATISIISNAVSSTSSVQVSGTGTAPPQPAAAAITVTTDQPVYHRAQPVQISGAVTDSTGTGISNVPVAVQIMLNGLSRVLNPYTDSQGNYHTTFQPMPTDGGTFQVTATASSGGATQTATTSFRVFGLLLSLNSLTQDLVMGTSVSVPLNLQNIGDASLNNVTYTASITPTGTVTASFAQSLTSLAPGAPVTIPMTLTAPAGNPPTAPVTVQINVSSTDSVSGGVDPESSSLIVTLRPAVSTLALNPATLSVGVNPGGSLTRQFQVQNVGYMASSNSIVTLQDPATYNWVTLGNANLGNLGAGASQIFQVMINPPSTLPLGNYTVLFNVSGGSSSLQGTLNISVTQSTLGAVAFTVNDDTGSKVSGATVTLYNSTTGKSFQGVTASDGTDTISGVDAGDYNYIVAASSHDPGSGTVTVMPNATAQVSVLLSYDVVSLTFTVTPTTITDQYTVVLNITYATTLPKPALKVVPPNFNFSFYPADVPNGAYACSLSITNTSQFAQVTNVTADASQLDVSEPTGQQIHVQFADGTSVYQAGTLAPQASITVPCTATVDGNNVPTHAAGNIVVQGNFEFSLDGNLNQGTTTTNVPVSYTRPTDLSYTPIQFVYDETNPSGPTLEYQGGSFVYTVTSERPDQFNFLSPSGSPFGGDNIVAFTGMQGATTPLDEINANQSKAFWHGNFSSLKQSLLGQGDTTTYDISTLDGGLTLTQAVGTQIAANPAQALGMPMYLGFEGQWSDRSSADGYLVPIEIMDVTAEKVSLARPQKSEKLNCLDPEEPGCQDQTPELQPPMVTTEGQVQIEIEQKIRLERQAFNAMLGIDALATLNNTTASVQILDMSGNDASKNFFVLVTGDPLGATHGGTVIGSTSVNWQLIPMAGAGGSSPQGTQYQVQATLSYVVNGTAKTVTTQAVTITVLPSPQLTVAYTAPYVVMDSKDAKIRVTVQNTGYGTANNLTIQSMQPTVAVAIPADPSVPGLTVGFNITGSSNTADSTGYMPGNLTIDFGDVAPGATVSGYWTLHVTQRGFLVSLSSTFTHDDYQGVQLDPLVLPPTTTLVPAIGGTVTNSAGLPIPDLNVSLTGAGTIVGIDQTDAVTGEYYIQDLAAGSYLEQVTDSSGKVWASQNITVPGDQPANFVDFQIPNFVLPTTPATVTLDAASLSQTYDGLPKSVTATTAPAGLNVIFSYNGSFIPPVTAGSYNVVATIVDPVYTGTVSGTLTIAQATPIITWPPPAPIAYGTPLSGTQLDASVTMPGSSSGSQVRSGVAGANSVVPSSSSTASSPPGTRTPSAIAPANSGGKQRVKAQDQSQTLPATLAFTSDRSGRVQIYTGNSNPLPSPPSPVTTAGAGNQESDEPDWSSGGRIAYQFGAPGVRGIHRINSDGTGDIQLTPAQSALYPCADDRDPSWSPNGDFIAYACLAFAAGAAVPAGTYQIWEHDNNGPANDPLSESFVASVTGTQEYAPAWSPDGNSIAFVKAGPGAQAEIARLDMTSGFIYFLTQGGYTNFDPTWSPDSTQVAFSSTRAVPTGTLFSDGMLPVEGDSVTVGGQSYIFRNALTGLSNDVLIGHSAFDSLTNLAAAINGKPGEGSTYGIGTLPNTEVFVPFVAASSIVVQARQAGTGIIPAAHSAHLTWSGTLTPAPGGHHVFVMSVLCPEAQAGCLPAVELTAGPGDDTKPAWSPDGSTIAFVSNRATPQNPSGKNQIYLIGPSRLEIPRNTWAAATLYQLGWQVIDTAGNVEQVTVSGTSGSSQPAWPASVGGSVTDGTVTWTNEGLPAIATVISDGTANDDAPAWNPEFVAQHTTQLNVQVTPVPVTVTAGVTSTPSQVTITVTDPSGNPVNGANVTIVPPQTGLEGNTPIAVQFSSLNGLTTNGQFTVTALEPNGLQNSYQFGFSVSSSGMVNGNPASGSTESTIDILGIGSILPPQPPPGVSNQQRLPVGAPPYTPQQKQEFYYQAETTAIEGELWGYDAISLGAVGVATGIVGAGQDAVILKNLAGSFLAPTYQVLADVVGFLGNAALIGGQLLKVYNEYQQLDIAQQYLDAASDPPDSDYSTVVLPTVQAPPIITVTGGPLSPNTSKLMNQSLAVKAVIQGYLPALQTSANRYSTAVNAGDLASAALQRDAILSYEDELVSLFNSDAQVTENLLSSFQQDSLPNFQLAVQDITSIQNEVAAYGLPISMTQDLQQLGVSAADIAQIRGSLATGDPTPFTTDFFSSLQSDAQSSLNAASAFTVGARPPGPVNTVTGNLVYTPPAGTLLNAGTQTLSVVFTPTDTTDYTTATATVPLQVSGLPATVALNPASLTQDYDGTPKFVTVTTNPASLSVSVAYTQNGNPVPAPTNVGTYSVTATIVDSSYQGMTTGTLTISGAGTKLCVAAPTGLVSWWTGDVNTSDVLGANNPSASNAVTLVPAEVGNGFTFGSGGYTDIPASASLANQQFTWSAWAKPNGPGPNSDSVGSVVVGQDIDSTDASAQLTWRATDNRFLFIFGSQSSDLIVSTDTFALGQFYLVTGTYDGSIFSLYVNGNLEGQLAETKTIAYSSLTWTIGSTDSTVRGTLPRTWNGVIDEVQAFNRALSQSEIQGIYNATTAGECRSQPTISSLAPNSGQQGQQNLTVAITGQFTNWVQGTTTANFGAGITVSSLNVNAATSATAVLNIDPAAVAGPQAVTLTTGSEIDTLASGFTLTPGTPILLSVNPGAGQQGQQENVTITGQFTHFMQGSTVASFGPGITVTSLTVNSSTSATAAISIDPTAPTGASAVVMTTGSEAVTLNNGFTVIAGTPVLLSVSPSTGRQGQQSLSVSITGLYTSFAQGTTTANFGSGVTVTSLTVASPTSATAVLNISASASTGARTVTLTTGGEVASLTNGFTVTAGAPALVSVSPANGQQGQQNLSVAVTGQFTNWVQGTTTANFGAGITVASLTVNSTTTATVSLNISATAATGTRTVTLTTGSEIDSLTNSFTVIAGTPVLVSASPNTGQQAQQNWSVALTGQFTNWVQGTTTASFGAGITVVSLTVNSSTMATAALNISASAATGARTVTLTTASEVDTLTNGFTVTAGTSALVSVNPNSGRQGQQNLSVAMTGLATNWVQGTTTANFGAGITVASLSVSSTSAVAVLNISASAATGAYTVTMTTGSEVETLANGFTVTAGAPTLLSINPASGNLGQQNLSVALTGQFTNWVQGTTTANFGAGITVASLTVSSATSATAVLNISSSGAVGARTVTMTTGSEIDSLTNGFLVSASACVAPPPGMVSWWPGDGNYNDIIGGNTGSPMGSVAFVSGEVGQAFQFAGSSYISVPANRSLDLTAFTVDAWINPAITGNQYIVDKSVSFSVNYSVDLLADNRIEFGFFDSNDWHIADSSSTCPVGVWCHVAATYDGSTLQVYVNGSPDGSLSYAGTPPGGQPLRIGERYDGEGPFQGIIDEVEIFNRALSSSEIQGIYNAGSAGKCKGQPAISSVAPNSGQQGQQNLSVALTGYFTNWVQGTTTASFGTGITVASLTVNSATSATAVLNISATAATGVQTVTLTTGSEVDTLANGFTVTAGTPTLVSINPNSGTQGQQNLSVALTGQYTNWVQGTTTASFGAGITVASLAVNSPTSATAVIDIASAAATGSQTVTITTGSEVDTLVNGFTINAGAPVPVLVSVTPSSGQQGQQNLSVTLAGQFTNWVQGTTTANFGAGITVASLTVNSATSATAVLNISFTAAAGARTVTLTTGSEVDTLTNGFTVTASTCTSPPSGMVSWWPGDGNYTDIIGGYDGTAVGGVSFAPGEVGQAFSFDGTTGFVQVPSNAALQPPNALTLDAWVYPTSFGANATSIISKYESGGGQSWVLWVLNTGQVLLGVIGSADGSIYRDVETDAALSLGTWQHVAATFDSATEAMVIYVNGVQVPTTVVPGSGTVTSIYQSNIPVLIGAIGLGSGEEYFWAGLIDEVNVFNRALSASEIQAIYNAGSAGKCKGQPTLSSVTPNSGQQGQQNLSVALTGYFTNWVQGTTSASFGAGITVASLTVNSPTSATAILNISTTAATGAQTVSLTTGSEVDTLANGFTVTAGTPTLVSINPNSGTQGQQNLSVALAGQYTSWVQGTSVASFGAGITVASLAVNSPTSATAVIDIASAAATGPQTVTMTTGTEVDTLANGFTINAGAPIPVLVSVTPNSGQHGQQNLSVTLTGQFTNWVQGTTTASFGAGITVTSLTVSSPTSATAVLNISFSAATGARTVTLTTGSEIDTLANGFSVTANACITPPSGMVSWWPGDGNANDIIGGNNGTLQNGATFAPGEVGQAFSLDGNGQYVDVGPVNLPSTFTVDLWLDPTAVNQCVTSHGPQLISRDDFLSNRSYYFEIQADGTLLFSVKSSQGFTQYVGNTIIQTGAWQHIVATYDGAAPAGQKMTFFVNGASIPASPIGGYDAGGTPLDVPLSTKFGILGDGVTCPLNGFIDEVEFFNRVLSASEIQAIYNAGSAGECKGEPTLSSAAPNSGQQGQQNLSVALTGYFTNWVQGTTTASFGAGITVASLTVNSATSATAVLNISTTAATGAQTVALTTGSEIDTLTNGFTITTGSSALVSVNPTAGVQGQQNLSVALRGQLTNWAQGTTTVSFGSGITVVSLTVNSATSATAVIDIAAAAATGAQTVTLTTGGETDTLTNGFTVTALATTPPQVVQTNPASGAGDVSVESSVVVTFNEAVNPSTVTTTSFTVVDLTTGLGVSGQSQLDPTNTIATFTPTQPFAASHLFSATLTTAIKSAEGISLAANFSFGFSTGSLEIGEADAVLYSLLNTGGSPGGGGTAPPSEADAVLYSVLNTGGSPGGGGTAPPSEADAVLYSLLNTGGSPGGGGTTPPSEADAVLYSLLNTGGSPGGGGTTPPSEADAVLYSLLNTGGNPGGGGTAPPSEADAIIFSVQNNDTGSSVKPAVIHPPIHRPVHAPAHPVHPPTLLDSDDDGYPDDLEIALGSDPYDPNSVPVVHPVPEAESGVFSVVNEAAPTTRRRSDSPVQVAASHGLAKHQGTVPLSTAGSAVAASVGGDGPASTDVAHNLSRTGESVVAAQLSSAEVQQFKYANYQVTMKGEEHHVTRIGRSHRPSIVEAVLGLWRRASGDLSYRRHALR